MDHILQDNTPTAHVHETGSFKPLISTLAQKNNVNNSRSTKVNLQKKTVPKNSEYTDAPKVETLADEAGTIKRIIITCSCGQQLELDCNYTAGPTTPENN